jgi:hypothetical protein
MLMKRNGGVHEPQEERYYQEVLKLMPQNAVMLELGAWWGFYSLWLQKERPQARCVLVEPNASNLAYGKKNFKINNARGEFLQAFIDKTTGSKVEGVQVMSVDDICAKFNLTHLNILHADIQGYELAMLQGAGKILNNAAADFCFVSTHSDELHGQCAQYLKSKGYKITVDIAPVYSFSVDGILVAVSPKVEEYPQLKLSMNTAVAIPVTL